MQWVKYRNLLGSSFARWRLFGSVSRCPVEFSAILHCEAGLEYRCHPGRFSCQHQGGLIQLALFSVVGGVLSASGFLVFSEAFRIVTRHSLDFSLLEVLHNTPLIAVLPALSIAIVLEWVLSPKRDAST